jgi:glycosyltransferase involved in cell wall biosynthesis
MKIVLLHFTVYPVVGGVERIIEAQKKTFKQLGYEVQVNDGATGRLYLKELLSMPSGASVCIIAHNVMTMPFDLKLTSLLMQVAKDCKWVKVVDWVHDIAKINVQYAHLPWDQPEYKNLLNSNSEMKHITISANRVDEYTKAFVGADIMHIPNGLDLQTILGISSRVEQLQLLNWDLVLFHPTRWVRRKNIECGVRVTAALKERGVQVLYLLSGAVDPHLQSGLEYYQEIKQEIKQLGLDEDSIQILAEQGILSDDDLRSLYIMSDALFFPSLQEGFSLPIAEAQIHQLKVFCSDIKTHQEFKNVHYFNPFDSPHQIAEFMMDQLGVTLVNPCTPRKQRMRELSMIEILKNKFIPLLRNND